MASPWGETSSRKVFILDEMSFLLHSPWIYVMMLRPFGGSKLEQALAKNTQQCVIPLTKEEIQKVNTMRENNCYHD